MNNDTQQVCIKTVNTALSEIGFKGVTDKNPDVLGIAKSLYIYVKQLDDLTESEINLKAIREIKRIFGKLIQQISFLAEGDSKRELNLNLLVEDLKGVFDSHTWYLDSLVYRNSFINRDDIDIVKTKDNVTYLEKLNKGYEIVVILENNFLSYADYFAKRLNVKYRHTFIHNILKDAPRKDSNMSILSISADAITKRIQELNIPTSDISLTTMAKNLGWQDQ